PGVQPATRLRPGNVEALGYFHLLLRQAGATQRPDGYELNGRSIRVINGSEAILGSLRTKFIEPPTTMASDIVVAVGATDLGVPSNVVRAGRSGDLIRPEAAGNWFDLNGARAELNI